MPDFDQELVNVRPLENVDLVNHIVDFDRHDEVSVADRLEKSGNKNTYH